MPSFKYFLTNFLIYILLISPMFKTSKVHVSTFILPFFIPSSVCGMPLQNVGTSTPQCMKSSPTTRIFQIRHIVAKIVTRTISLNNVCVHNALLQLWHQWSHTLSLFYLILFSVRHHSCAGPSTEELLHRYYKEYSPFDVSDAVDGFVSFSNPTTLFSHCVVFEVPDRA